MKNSITAFFIATFFIACEKKQAPQNTDVNQEDTTQIKKDSAVLSIDSLSVQDSAKISKNLSADYYQKLLIFKGLKQNVLDSLYFGELALKDKPMQDFSKENVQKRMNENMKKYFDDTKEGEDYVRDYPQTWDEHSDMKVFTQTKDFLTINYNGYGFSGGAHGYGYDLYKTVDLKNQNIVQLADIVNEAKIKWQPILLKHVDKGMLFDENINANRNFYFDSQSITFIYNQYEIAPYASGIIEIKVPFSEIKQALKPDFKKRLNIN